MRTYRALVLVEFSSLPLLVLSLIYLVTGYIMVSPEIERVFCRLGLCSREALYLHTDRYIRTLLVLFSYIHGLSGLVLLIERHVRPGPLRQALYILVTVLSLTVLALVIVAEVS